MLGDARQANPDAALALGADKGYDAAEFVEALQDMFVPAGRENGMKTGRLVPVPAQKALNQHLVGQSLATVIRRFELTVVPLLVADGSSAAC